MRYSQSGKMEIIRMVEESELPVKRTLQELDIPRSTFYGWYRKYETEGYDGPAAADIVHQLSFIGGPQDIYFHFPNFNGVVIPDDGPGFVPSE